MIATALLAALPAAGSAADRTVGGAYSTQGPGPANGESNTVTTGSGGNREICGALESVVAHPTAATTLWAGSVNGGIFRTNNATTTPPTWTAQTTSLNSLSISALEFDPTGSTTIGSETLVAGTGNVSSYGGVFGGNLLMRTTDGGSNWTQLAAAGLANGRTSGLAPRGATIVAAMRLNGLYRSTDTGASFTSMSGTGGAPTGGRTYDLQGNPLANAELFTVFSNGSSNDGVYRSTDTGATWTKASSAAIDALLPNASNVHISVGRQGTAGSANVYVAVVGNNSKLSGLFRSGDSGATWTQLTTPTTTENAVVIGIHPGSQGSIHLSLQADPTNHSVVYIGGDRQPCADGDACSTSFFPNSIGAVTFSGRLFKVDAAQTGAAQISALTDNGTQNATAPHADSRDMAMDANGNLIQTDDGGIFRRTSPTTTNGTAGNWFEICGNLSAVEHHDASYDTSSNTLFGGNQDNGTTFQTAQNSATWTQVMGGDGGDVEVKAGDDISGGSCGTPCSTRYYSSQNLGSLRRRPFTAAGATGGSSTNLNLTGITPNFRTPIKANKSSNTHFVIGAQNAVFESSDRGANFTNILNGVAVEDFSGTPLAYGTNASSSALYFTSGSNIYARTGAHFTAPTQVTTPSNGGDTFLDVAIDPANANNVVVVDQDQVFRSTNAGNTWTDITAALVTTFSPGTINTVTIVDGNTATGIVVGTNRGVFRSTSNGSFTNWDRLGTGLPNALVYDVEYDKADDVLAVGTMGRGSWKLTGIDATVPVELQWIVVE